MPFAIFSKRVALAVTAGLLTLGLSTFGATAAHAESASTTISGVVTANGVPLADALVCADVEIHRDGVGYVDASGTCASTDAKGVYSISFLLEKTSTMSTVTVQATDAYPETTAGSYRNGMGGYFTVNPGDTITKNVAVTPYASAPTAGPTDGAHLTQISGVATLDGVPLVGVEACASVPVYNETAGYINAAGACVTTDSAGAYKFLFSLPVESSMASVWVNPSDAYLDIFPTTTAGAGGRDIHGYFTIKPGDDKVRNTAVKSYPLVSGRVVDPAGAPIVGASLDGGVKAVVTDSTGAYAVRVRTAYDGGRILVTAAGYGDGFLRVDQNGKTSSGDTVVVLKPVATKVTGAKPAISGKVKLGRVLTAKAGVWGPQSVRLSYQWYRNGKKIAGATEATHRVTWRDVNKKITVKVTGSLAGMKSLTVASKSTKKVTLF
jgi:hypothetical protein